MPTTRDEAIALLAAADLAGLSDPARAEQLEIMTLEDWSDSPAWVTLNADVRVEFERGRLEHPTASSRYDAALLLWLRSRYAGSTNVYLRDCLRAAGSPTSEVVGHEPQLEACPCCGRASLGERGVYEICQVCWWEDDGQDNDEADAVLGGPNQHLSLTQARANFLLHGISDPRREDLRALQAPPAKHAPRREFAFSQDRDELREVGSAWSSRAFNSRVT